MSRYSETLDPAQRSVMLQKMLEVVIRHLYQVAGKDELRDLALAFASSDWMSDEEAMRMFLDSPRSNRLSRVFAPRTGGCVGRSGSPR
jgi:hypothetical protein